MNIALTHFRVGETDGVSLEMDKWKTVLEKMGHNVCYIAGTEGTAKAHIIKEMDYRGKKDALINKECFESAERFTEAELIDQIESYAEVIEKQFVKIIMDNKIDLIIPNNLLSLGRSPHIAIALTNAILRTGIKTVGHHHDFFWEREYFSDPQSPYAEKLIEEYFPPRQLKDMEHVVINIPAQKDLLIKKGKNSIVVPNVFDFDRELWTEDEYNKSFKSDLGIGENEVVFLQATRVTNRKAIELAVDLIALLNTDKYRKKLIGKKLYNGKTFGKDTKLTLAMVGLHEGGDNYEEKLITYAKLKDVNTIVCPEKVDHSRKMDEKGNKVYSLWDAYVFCDIITYPSIYEGWGNQFLEGLFAKKPLIVFEYSVFKSDIKAFGFDYISLGNKFDIKSDGLACISDERLEKAAEETIEYLTDKDLHNKAVDKNYEIGKKHLSLDALKELIMQLEAIK